MTLLFVDLVNPIVCLFSLHPIMLWVIQFQNAPPPHNGSDLAVHNTQAQ